MDSWNAFKKLSDRDEEIIQINQVLVGYQRDLEGEIEEMKEQTEKNQNSMQEEGASTEKL